MGPLTATALLAFVGDARRFPTGRHFASYLGLTPREYSSGLRIIWAVWRQPEAVYLTRPKAA